MIFLNGTKVFTEILFPDGTCAARIDKNKLKDAYGNTTIKWLYDGDDEAMKLYYLVGHIRSCDKDAKITLFLPYIPNARMDREKEGDGKLFTLKYFAKFINDLKFEKVIVNDAHSNVALALIDRVKEVQPVSLNIKSIIMRGNINLAFYPDEGASKKYSEVLSGHAYRIGMKKRNWITAEITGYEVMADKEEIEGKNILIVDDICSKGGTFYHAAKALKDKGANDVYLWVTHCENNIANGELLKDDSPIKHIFTTNDILRITHPKITIFEV